jgi:hypothetical protein
MVVFRTVSIVWRSYGRLIVLPVKAWILPMSILSPVASRGRAFCVS